MKIYHYVAHRSHDQDGCNDHTRKKPFRKILRNPQTDFHESGTPAHHSLFK